MVSSNRPKQALAVQLRRPTSSLSGEWAKRKACETPLSTPKDPRETPKTTNHDGTVAPSGCPWPCAGGPQGRPEDTLGARTEGTAKTAPNKNPEPLNKKRRGQEKDNKNTPQIRSPFTRVSCSSPSGELFGRRRGTKKTQTPSFYCSFGPQGVPKR